MIRERPYTGFAKAIIPSAAVALALLGGCKQEFNDPTDARQATNKLQAVWDLEKTLPNAQAIKVCEALADGNNAIGSTHLYQDWTHVADPNACKFGSLNEVMELNVGEVSANIQAMQKSDILLSESKPALSRLSKYLDTIRADNSRANAESFTPPTNTISGN